MLRFDPHDSESHLQNIAYFKHQIKMKTGPKSLTLFLE